VVKAALLMAVSLLAVGARLQECVLRKPACLLLLLLVSALPVQAQFADASNAGGPVTISEAWRFHTGDNPEWAASDFDDSQWPLLRTGRSWSDQGYPDYSGYAWYRIRVKLPANSAPLAMVLTLEYVGAEAAHV
jgi:hypothetical protein